MIERMFALNTENATDAKQPASNEHLFRGLTQEQVEMDRRIREEHERSAKRDDELKEEMYSFGMIECSVFDSRAKLVRVHIDKNTGFNVPVKSTSLDGFLPTDATTGGLLDSGADLCLTPTRFTYASGGVNRVEAEGSFSSQGKSFACVLTYDTTGEDASLAIFLCGAIVESGRLCIPTTTGTTVPIKMNLIDCYM